MKSIIQILSIIFILLINFGCSKKESFRNDVEIIDIDVTKKDVLTYSDLFKLKKIILFDSLIVVSKIQKTMLINEDIILVQCGGKINHLVLKNMITGSIKIIGSKGKGPGEYTKLSDFIYDKENSQIWLLDGSQGKVIKYKINGDFVSELKNETLIYARSFFNLKDGRIAVYGGVSFYGSAKYRVLIFDTNSGQVLDKKFEIPENQVKFMHFLERSNFTYNGLFHYKYHDTFYKVNSENIEAKFSITFGDKDLPKDMLDRDYRDVRHFVESCKETPYAHGISNVLEIPKGLFFTFNYKSELMHCFYNYDSKKYVLYNTFKNDIYGLLDNEKTNNISIPRGGFNNTLVYKAEPFEIKSKLDELRKLYTDSEWNSYYNQRKDWIDLFDSMRMDSNSVLIFLEIKQ